MGSQTDQIQLLAWKDAVPGAAYEAWRAAKLKAAEADRARPPVEIENIAEPSESARAELVARNRRSNFALYVTDPARARPEADAADPLRQDLRRFAARLGLRIAEAHRSADGSGIVPLRVSQVPAQAAYIPYSTRAMNWHTDGYYNAAGAQVLSFVLHCARAAAEGGASVLLDPEIAFLRLFDRDPRLVRALMHPAAMAIPANVEPDGSIRPFAIGPVFFADAASGRLQMRYTARSRSVIWRDDPATREAAAALVDILADEPCRIELRLAPGSGILTNNALHARTAFSDGPAGTGRTLYRVRFHNRISGS